MKSAIEEILDFAIEHEALCATAAKMAPNKATRKQVEAGEAAFRLVAKKARELIKKQKSQPKIIML